MKLTNYEKEIVEQIINGKVYNLLSYINFSRIGSRIIIDQENVKKDFLEDTTIEKKYYLPNGLKQSKANLITHKIYQKKISENKINPKNHTYKELELSYNTGIQTINLSGKDYTLDFYKGVLITTDENFEKIINFFVLWEYLKSEKLVLEVPNKICEKDLGVLFVPSESQKRKEIDFNSLTIDDKYYIDKPYKYSDERYLICKEFLHKQILPTTRLKKFKRQGYRTFEEKAQKDSLIVAWIAVIISILLSLFSILYQPSDPNLEKIKSEVKKIESKLHQKSDEKPSDKFDKIIKELEQIENNQQKAIKKPKTKCDK